MPMNDEVRKAVESRDRGYMNDAQWKTIRAELTRLTEIAEGVDPLVVRMGEVTTRLEAANRLLRAASEWIICDDLDRRIEAHLSEPRT